MSLTPKKHEKTTKITGPKKKDIGMYTVAEVGFLNDVFSFYHVIELEEEYWRIVAENINTGRFIREDEYTDEAKAKKAWERVKKSIEKREKDRVKNLKKQLYRRRLTLQNTTGRRARRDLLWKIEKIKEEIAFYEKS